MNAEFRLGIQSYCFRNFKPLPHMIDCVKQVGLEYVEVWPEHLEFQDSDEVIATGLAQLDAAGITIDGYGAIKLPNDETLIHKYLGFCRRAGVATATILDIDEAALDLVQRLCDEYDVNVAMHNHGKEWKYGSYESISALLRRTSSRVGVCLDTGWALQAEEDPIAGVHLFRDRLYGVHLKEFVIDAEGNRHDVLIGSGALDLPGLLRALNDTAFSGYLSLEYVGDPDNPLPEVKQCLEIFHNAMATL